MFVLSRGKLFPFSSSFSRAYGGRGATLTYLQNPLIKSMYQPLVLRAMQGDRTPQKGKMGQTQQIAAEVTNDFIRFMVKRYSVIQDVGILLESETVQMSRVLSILPGALDDRRRKCLEATAGEMGLDVDLQSLKQLLASAIILEPNTSSIKKSLGAMLEEGINSLPTEPCIDTVDVLLLCAYALRDRGMAQRLLKCLVIDKYLDKLDSEVAKLERMTLLLNLGGVPPVLLPRLSSAFLGTVTAMREQTPLSLSTLRHVWEAQISLNGHNTHALSRAIYSLVETSVSERPYQLGHDVDVPLSLLSAMLNSRYKSSSLISLVMNTMQTTGYYGMSQRHQLKYVNTLAALGEDQLALSVLWHHSRDQVSRSSAPTTIDPHAVQASGVPLVVSAMEILHAHLDTVGKTRQHTPSELCLALMCFNRHANTKGKDGGSTLLNGAARNNSHDPFGKALARIEADLQGQLEGDSDFSLAACAQLVNCYGQVGRRHDSLLRLLNEKIRCELEKEEKMSAQLARLMQALARSHARLHLVPPYLDTLVNRLLEYYNPLNDPAGINNPLSGNPNKAASRLKGAVSLLWSLSVLGRLDRPTYDRLEPILTLAWNKHGRFVPAMSTALERVLLDLRLSEDRTPGDVQAVRPWEKSQELMGRDTVHTRGKGKGKNKGKAKGKPPSSSFHLDVSHSLRLLGVHHTNEVAVEGGYVVDILIPPNNASSTRDSPRGTVIEVDGPFHFETYRNEPLGPTVSKRRHLELLGYRVVSVPYWTWDIHGLSAGSKEKYLKGLLAT